MSKKIKNLEIKPFQFYDKEKQRMITTPANEFFCTLIYADPLNDFTRFWFYLS